MYKRGKRKERKKKKSDRKKVGSSRTVPMPGLKEREGEKNRKKKNEEERKVALHVHRIEPGSTIEDSSYLMNN